MSDRRTSLVKALGPFQLFTIAFGAAIGVGWIVVLGEWLNQAGPLGIVLGFVAGGTVIALVALCYAEMASRFPVSGGEFVYTYEIYGPTAGFLIGWFLALAYVTVTAFEAIAVGWVVGTLIPGIEGPVIATVRGEPLRAGSLALGVIGTVLLAGINLRGVRSAARVQDVLTTAKVLVFLIFVGAAFAIGRPENLTPYFQRTPTGTILPGILAIFLATPNWLGGFGFVPQLMEEKRPGTSLATTGWIMALSVVLSTAFYCLVVLACSLIVPWHDLVGQNLPAATAFRLATGSTLLMNAVLLTGLFGLVTVWNATLMGASRLLFALGRVQLISPWFGRVHPRSGAPVTSVAFIATCALLGLLLGRKSVIPLLNVTATVQAVAFALVSIGVLVRRRAGPAPSGGFRAPGGIVTPALAALGSLVAFGLALYQPYAAAGRFPLEWMLIGGWGVLGAVIWARSKGARSGISPADRRKLMLGE